LVSVVVVLAAAGCEADKPSVSTTETTETTPEDTTTQVDTEVTEDTESPEETGDATDTATTTVEDTAAESCGEAWADAVVREGVIPVNEDFPHLTDGVLLEDDLLLLAGQSVDFSDAVWSFDVSDPANPVLLGSGGTQQLMGICWAGDRGFGMQLTGALTSIKLEDRIPKVAGLMDLGVAAGRLDCDEEVVAWGAGADNSGGAIADELPDLWYPIPGDVRDTLVEGDRLWALGYDVLVAYDLDRTARTLTETGRLALPGGCYDLEDGEDWLAASCSSAGVYLIDRGAGVPAELGRWSGYASARTSEAAGDTLLVSVWTDLLVLDVSDPTAPVLVASEEHDEAIAASVWGGEDLVYVIDWKKPFTARFNAAGGPEVRSLQAHAVPGEDAVIYNDGTVDLCLETPSSGELSGTLVSPGYQVRWSIPDDAEEGDVFSVSTNDADESVFSLVVGGNEGLTVGDAAPDFVEPDTEGVIWQLSALRGQTVFLGMMEST